MSPTRREFMEAGAAAAALWHLDGGTRVPIPLRAAPTLLRQDPDPDLIVVNGTVYTIDDAQPRAEAFAVKHGRFVAVGSNSDIRNLATRNTIVMDAEGMTVTPDAHRVGSALNPIRGADEVLRHRT